MLNQHSMSRVNSQPGGVPHGLGMALMGGAEQQFVPGLANKETMTFRGQLESLESVLVDIVSEVKYHRRQVEIIKAEKDTSNAVLGMNIVQAKNSVLNQEFKTAEEIKRNHRRQETGFENLNAQVDVLNHDTYTADTRLMQMQRRIIELESVVGFPRQKLI